MNSTQLFQVNKDVQRVITSFISHYDRLLSLRKKYTNKFLEEGLQKKTMTKLQHILVNIIAIIQTGFLSSYQQWFYTVGVNVDVVLNRPNIPYTFLEKYCAISGNKQWKINRIIELYKRACDIVVFRDISKFYYEFQEGNRIILINPAAKLSRDLLEDLSQRIIKLLCILTIVIKSTPNNTIVNDMSSNELHHCTFKTPT